jgi:Co/Zn/Cd efflux system component
MEDISAHVVLSDDNEPQTAPTVLEAVSALLKKEFGIDHSTIQIEHSDRRDKEIQH